MAVAAICQLSLAGSATASVTAATAARTSDAVTPNATNELDCNGWSSGSRAVKAQAGELCADPIKVIDGKGGRFLDNGWYVGHDEPGIRFISNTPGSANTMTYLVKLPVDPQAAPTATGSVTNYGQDSIAPWFGLAMCDPNSYPQNPCTPDSDSNISDPSNPADAGSAFMELQLYPPGYTPFVDNTSCSVTKWCAALTIDSLECNFDFETCNPNCEEPGNFAFIQTNGVPTGPPSPQEADVSSFLPNANTLLFNQGDVLQLSISDPPQGFTTVIRDLTTHQTGYMVASASNGFMNTNINTCDGTPWTFHAEFSTASATNQVPWAADLAGGPLVVQEIGHSEVCNSLKYQDPFSESFENGQSFVDNDTYDTCVGGSEGPGQVGEGPCTTTSSGITCQNADTQGPNGESQACPSNNPQSGDLCEYADAFCFPQGARTITVNGVDITAWSDDNQCSANRYQNGDLDFDGLSYQRSAWPSSSNADHPTPMEYIGPFQANGQPYPQIQFETDINGSASLCDTATGAGCVVPPTDANFYPYYSLLMQPGALGSHQTSCPWTFGGDLSNTLDNFGGDREYGTPDVARFGGTSTSPVQPNLQFSFICTSS